MKLLELVKEFDKSFTSMNEVDVPSKVSVSRDEWRALKLAILEQMKPVTRVPYSPFTGKEWKLIHSLEELQRAFYDRTFEFNPWTGTPRDPRDIESDPLAVLCVPQNC